MWLGKYRQPGCRIFSEIKDKDKDIRFQKQAVREKYSEIYERMPVNDSKELATYHNGDWYKIYRKHQDSGKIYYSQRDYLLCRDLFVSTLNMAGVYLVSIIIAYCLLRIRLNSFVFWVFLLAEVVVTYIATHLKGWRFTYNVIAEDVSE